MTIDHSIVASNTAVAARDVYRDPVSPPLTSAGYNLIGDGDVGLGQLFPARTGDQVGAPGNPINPRLGSLRNNGGPTPTLLPLAGSPALNTGNPLFAGFPFNDQRGYRRIAGARIDIGAVESCLTAYYPFDNSSADETAGSMASYLDCNGGIMDAKFWYDRFFPAPGTPIPIASSG